MTSVNYVRSNIDISGPGTYIEICEHDGRVLDHDLDRLDDSIPKHIRCLQILLLDFTLRFDVVSPSCFPETCCPPPKNIIRRCLRIREKEDDENWSCQPYDFPKSPPPALGLYCKGSYYWSNSGSPETSCCPG